MSDPVQRLAVYGTLAPGGANADVLAGVDGTWATGTTRGTRHERGWRGYPGLVLDDGGDVEVAVLTSPALESQWRRLDAFEGPGYRRVLTDVLLGDGRRVRAHVYVLARPPDRPDRPVSPP